MRIIRDTRHNCELRSNDEDDKWAGYPLHAIGRASSLTNLTCIETLFTGGSSVPQDSNQSSIKINRSDNNGRHAPDSPYCYRCCRTVRADTCAANMPTLGMAILSEKDRFLNRFTKKSEF
ncbi:hypothetical protein TNCV_4021051 [Trichonephila clavipes]|nr:hypothetical protein TNCV_4021051 [Trichonephila clavipes]